MNKNTVSSLISKYAQVVLWFCRTGLLPEGSGRVSSLFKTLLISAECQGISLDLCCLLLDYDTLQISRPFYTHSAISNYYTIHREELTRLAKSVAYFFIVFSNNYFYGPQYLCVGAIFWVATGKRGIALLLRSQGQVVCRLPDDRRSGRSVWRTLVQFMEKG